MNGSSNNGAATIEIRTILIGLVFAVLLCAITPYNNYYLQNTKLSGNHLPVGSIFVLLFLVFFVNTPLRLLKVRFRLSSAELSLIWTILVVALSIPSMGFLQFLLPTMVVPYYLASNENDWVEVLHPHLPEWLMVPDLTAATDFYQGTEMGGMAPWRLWLKPLLFWSLFILVFYFTTVCLAAMLRKQWVERERFSYPLVQVPLELSANPTDGHIVNRFFRNRLLWFGMALPVGFHLINGLHAYIPSVPEIPRIYNIYKAFTAKPWHTIGWWPATRIVIYFSVIGIAALLTIEVSFSLWFFYIFFKIQYIIMNAVGLSIGPWISCSRQVMGGYLVFVPAVLWATRHHFRDIFRRAFGQSSPQISDRSEPLPYRLSGFGFVIGFLTLVAFTHLAGISWWVSTITMMSVFITTIVLTWMIVNGGLLLVQAPFFPSEYMSVTLGSSPMGNRSLAVLSLERGFLRDWGELMMPHFLHGFRISDQNRLPIRSVVPILFLSIVVAIVVSAYASLDLIYNKGAINMHYWVYVRAPGNYFNRMSTWIQFPREARWDEIYSMMAGGLFTFGVLWLRQRFVWFNLHPIGYLLGATYPPFHLWSSVFIGWLIKYYMLKFSGMRGNRNLRYICLGLIFGEYLMVGFWMILGLFTGVRYFALPS